MGEIFLARQTAATGFDRLVILKTLLPDLAERDGFEEQFLDEARVTATLNHPNVVSIFEVGSWQNVHVIAMEYIAGINLARLMDETANSQTKIPLSVAVKIVRDAASALDHAHRATDPEGNP